VRNGLPEMRKTDTKTISELVVHAQAHPDQSYRELAASFGISEVSVKRYCATIGRGKDWRRNRKKIENTGAVRLWAAVDKLTPDDCWPWKGARNSSGYGFLHFQGKSQGAHRAAYELTYGKIAEGIEVDHLCRNRLCCNPAHLEPITHEENMRRVRAAQTKNREGVQSRSRGCLDIGLSIDTPTNIPIAAVIDGALTVSNQTSINPNSVTTSAPAVSIGQLSRSPVGPVVRMPPMKRETNVYIVRDSTGDIHVRIPSRSKEEAMGMFTCVWGEGYQVKAEKIENTSDHGEIEKWLGGWREQLRERFAEWKDTPQGKRRFDALQAENQKKSEAQRLRQDEHDFRARFNADWDCHYPAHTRAKLSAQLHRPSTSQSKRFERDDDEHEGDELDY
jgi:HNH endonuclease